MANSLKVSGDSETGNEEQHISPLHSVGRETNGAWLISSALGLLEQRARNAEGMWSNLPVAGQGGLLWSGGARPGGLGSGTGWDAALLGRPQ